MFIHHLLSFQYQNSKFHDKQKNVGVYNLKQADKKTQTQLFIDNYKHFQNQGALDTEKVIESAIEKTTEECKNRNDLKPLSMPRSNFRSKPYQSNAAKPISKQELKQEDADFALDVEDLLNDKPTTGKK